MPGATGGNTNNPSPSTGSLGGFIGSGNPRTGSGGVVVHAPTLVTLMTRGEYASVLPDGQRAVVKWSDGEKKYDYPDGAGAGRCDSIVSTNKLIVGSGTVIDWDIHGMSEPGNNLGHGDAEDNLGIPQHVERLYTLLLKNWSNADGSFGTLRVGASTSNEWTTFLEAGSYLQLPPDSVAFLVGLAAPGLAVASDNRNLKLSATGGDVVAGLNYAGSSQ